MARTPVIAAGGIVVRSDAPLFAVVRLRKRDQWVLPKGKLDPGESARHAAEREAVEETGHDVTVHEFVGTVAYEVRDGPKIVHFWRMEAAGGQVHELMRDISAVAWLPLETALTRLSRAHERAFLAEVGPRVLDAAHGLGAAPGQPPLVPELSEFVSAAGDMVRAGAGAVDAGRIAVAARGPGTTASITTTRDASTHQGWFARIWRRMSRAT